MANGVYILFSIIDLVLLFTGAFLAYRIYTFHNLSKGWLTVPLGFFLMGIRRILATSNYLGYFQNSFLSLEYVDSVFIPLIITLLLVFGLWAMYHNFQSFSLVQSGVEKKVQAFKKSQRRKKKR
ncbi:hypothetical protein EXS74_02870 [Candidatus Woesearchaeota archaeon]|nr:hypothetical protein [Candidatus Woesearchaeota archaeon]